MVRLLLVSTPAYGHVSPLLSIAADLIARGHDLTVITGSGFQDDVLAAGARFVPLHGVADFDLQDLIAGAEGLAPGPELLNHGFQRAFIDPVPVQHELVQRELAAAGDEPVVLVTDNMCLAGWPVALGAPGIRPAGTIAVGVTMLTVTSAEAPPSGLGIPLDTSPGGRAAIAQANAGHRAVFTPMQTRLEQVMAELGVTAPVPYLFDGIASVPDRLLQLAPSGFEYPRSDAPAGVRFIGPVPAAPPVADAPLPGWWSDVEAAERVVVVTQGTVANRDATALLAAALRALADLDALVVATTGPGGADPGEVPGNARVAEFVPFDLLLPHTDVLVTNGGYGGVLKALSHGVPLVVAGDTEDKPEIAEHVAWSGAGINLRTGRPSDAAVGEAVRAVLDDPSYARRASALQAEIATLRPYDEVAAHLEELLAARPGSSGAATPVG